MKISIILIIAVILSVSFLTIGFSNPDISGLSLPGCGEGGITCIGYQVDELEVSVTKGLTNKAVLGLPKGATVDKVVPLCLIKTYITDGDDDAGWICTKKQISKNGKPAFEFTLELRNTTSDYSTVEAFVLVIDTAEFKLVQKFTGSITKSGTAEKTFTNVKGSYYVLEVNRYDTNADDDFRYSLLTKNKENNKRLVVVDVKDGNDKSRVDYGIYQFLPVGEHAKMCQQLVKITKGSFSWRSDQDSSLPEYCKKEHSDLDQLAYASGSIYTYQPMGDEDFGIHTSFCAVDLVDKIWKTNGWGESANDKSYAWMQLTYWYDNPD